MRKSFLSVIVSCFTIGAMAQTYTSGLTATGSGGSTNVRLGGANPLLQNTTIDLDTFSFGFKKLSANYFTMLSSGNIGINNASPTYKLDVLGTTRFIGQHIFQGMPSSDTAALSGEMLSSANWTTTGWTGNFSSFTHTTGNTTALTNTLVAAASNFYQITYTIARTTGTISITFGGVTVTGLSTNGAIGIKSTSTGSLSIAPTTDFDGSVNISIKLITTSVPTSLFTSSDGVARLEIRAPLNGNNTFVGINSGRRNTTGASNVVFGYQAGQSNSTGSSGTFVGFQAGQANTSGNSNTFVGLQAGYNNLSGGSNTFLGYQSGYASLSGGDNTFLGRSSGSTNTTGISNTFTGNYAGNYNLTGSWNTFSGYMAGISNSSGNNNTAFGYQAGYNNTTGGNNAFLGYAAGKFIADGTTNATILNNSIIIGYNSKVLADNQTNQVVIGYNSTGLGSNTTVLGNSSTTKTAVYGSLLIGTTVDTASAIFNTTSSSKGALLPRMSSIQRTAISSPAKGLLVFDNDTSSLFQWNGTIWQDLYNSSNSGNSAWGLIGNGGTNTTTHFIGTSNNVGLAFRTNNIKRLLIDSTGNVGIGTTQVNDTAYRLFVEKGIRTRKVKVDVLNWADYVFDKDYKLPSLSEIDRFIQQNNHLPGVQPASEVQRNGIDVAETQAMLLKKVEELTLYLIELDKKINQLSAENLDLQKKVNNAHN